MKRKTYILSQFDKMTIVVTVRGQRFEVRFRGGFKTPYHLRGNYTTEDADVQNALEKHPLYPGEFFISEEWEIPDPVIEQVVDDPVPNAEEPSIEQPKVVEQGSEDQPHRTDESGTVQVSGVKNSQQAKLYLNRNFDVKMADLVNAEMIRRQAKIANVEFPDWQ